MSMPMVFAVLCHTALIAAVVGVGLMVLVALQRIM